MKEIVFISCVSIKKKSTENYIKKLLYFCSICIFNIKYFFNFLLQYCIFIIFIKKFLKYFYCVSLWKYYYVYEPPAKIIKCVYVYYLCMIFSGSFSFLHLISYFFSCFANNFKHVPVLSHVIIIIIIQIQRKISFNGINI